MDRPLARIPRAARACLQGLLVYALTATGGAALARTPGDATEAQLKAAFVFNFAKFVEWSPGVFPEATSPLVICILGEDPLDDALVESIRGKTINGRKVVVTRSSQRQLPKTCHILFIGRSEEMWLDEILSIAGGTHALTVSDIDRFAQRGGTIGLTKENNRMRFEVNLEAAERATLRISSRLLSLATTVLPAHPRHGG